VANRDRVVAAGRVAADLQKLTVDLPTLAKHARPEDKGALHLLMAVLASLPRGRRSRSRARTRGRL
jgi:hypothetical protein